VVKAQDTVSAVNGMISRMQFISGYSAQRARSCPDDAPIAAHSASILRTVRVAKLGNGDRRCSTRRWHAIVQKLGRRHRANLAASESYPRDLVRLSPPSYTTEYLPAGARVSISRAANVPSLNSLVNSLIAFSTTTSVSPSTRMYSFGSCPASGSLPLS
jgi:hypothetical protein